jgi:hypothetical protein
MNKKYDDGDIINSIVNDPKLRRAAAKRSHIYFFHLYLSDYAKYPTADFQKEMFAITQDDSIKTAVIVAFRGAFHTRSGL